MKIDWKGYFSYMSKHLHALGWAAVFLFHFSEDIIDGSVSWYIFSLNVTFVMSMAICFYFFYPRVWNTGIREQNLKKLIYLVPLGAVVFVASRFFLEQVVIKAIFGQGNYRDPYNLGYFLDNIFRPLSIILLSLILWLVQTREEMKTNSVVLEKEKTQAELAFLRSQINPHFLFNSLGFIQSRVYRADPEAAEMTAELSDLLRKAFEASSKKQSTVGEELELIQTLFSIITKRFKGKCFVDFEVDQSVLSKPIEPLILMAFAENMFKHGDLRSKEKPGLVSLRFDAGTFKALFSNLKMPGSPHDGYGIGLENTCRRLELIYPNKHMLRVRDESDRFTVNLAIHLP
jgi:hypothetical protein